MRYLYLCMFLCLVLYNVRVVFGSKFAGISNCISPHESQFFFFFINATVKKMSQLHLLHLLRFLYVVKLIRSGCGRSKCTLLRYAKDDVVYTGLGWMCVVLSSLFFFVLTGIGRYGIFL